MDAVDARSVQHFLAGRSGDRSGDDLDLMTPLHEASHQHARLAFNAADRWREMERREEQSHGGFAPQPILACAGRATGRRALRFCRFRLRLPLQHRA